MPDETIVAVYDTAPHAEAAVQDLLAANVPQSAIHRHTTEGSYAGAGGTATPAASQGFWSNLFGGESATDQAVYDSTLSKGGSVVTVTGVPGQDFEAVMAILERHNPIDIDERAVGMTQATTSVTPPLTAAPTTAPTATVPATTAGADTLQLSAEELVVGKRLVNQGGTRIRRYVVETPVSENVTLRSEQVTLDRRPVTDGRPVTDDSFGDKTIEMTEMAEEAVVSKTARVVEEVALRKEGVERVETIHDTVRKEEVEVEQLPGEAVRNATAPMGKPRI